jgi:transposase InsO family protein
MERIVAFTVITRSHLCVEPRESHPARRLRTVPTPGPGTDFRRIYGGSGKRPGPAVHDHVERNFTVQAPNHTWVTDITEHPTRQGRIYGCAIKDLFFTRIVGYAVSDRTADLAVTASSTGSPSIPAVSYRNASSRTW